MLLSLFLFLAVVLLLGTAFKVQLTFVLNEGTSSLSLKSGVGKVLLPLPKHLVKGMRRFIPSGDLHSLDQMLHSLKTGFRLMDSFLQIIETFHLQVRIGTGDPFLSALGCGGAWTLLGPIFSALSAADRLRSIPQISIEPDYNGVSLRLYLHCIFQFRLGQIIINELKRAADAWYGRTFS